MKGFIHWKQRKPEEMPWEQKGSAHALFPAHKWLCPQDAEIKHLSQNVGGGGRVFVWDSQILMDSRRGNFLPRSNSKVQRNVKAFISPVIFLPAKSRRGNLLLLGTKSPLWIINPQGEWAQEPQTSFLNVQEPWINRKFSLGAYRISLSLFAPHYPSLQYCFLWEFSSPLINHLAFIKICGDSRWGCCELNQGIWSRVVLKT